MTLIKQQTVPTSPDNRELVATLHKADGGAMTIEGEGNGPIDAFVDALKKAFMVEFSFIDYHEHAVGRGANATAASYVEIQDAEGRALHGVGMDPNIVMASLKATLVAVMYATDEAGGRGVSARPQRERYCWPGARTRAASSMRGSSPQIIFSRFVLTRSIGSKRQGTTFEFAFARGQLSTTSLTAPIPNRQKSLRSPRARRSRKLRCIGTNGFPKILFCSV